MSIHFIIPGNNADHKGNPMPKLKMTGKQQWTPRARKYARWKEYIVVKLIEHLQTIDPQIARTCARNYAAVGKPLVLGNNRARMDIVITWKNGVHGDSENVYGAIADALFFNDKTLSGSFDYTDGYGDGKVEVIITIEKNSWTQDQQNTKPPTKRKK